MSIDQNRIRVSHAVLASVVLALSALPRAVEAQSIQLSIVRPAVNAVASADLAIEVGVTSVFELASVTAQVDGRSTNLGYSQSLGRWTNMLSLAALSSGLHTLELSVTDVFANNERASRVFAIDRPPTLEVQEPFSATVVNDRVSISAAATDAEGIVIIRVSIPGSPTVIGTNRVHGTFPIGGAAGNTRVAFEATDSGGNRRLAIRQVIVERSSNLTEVAAAPGALFDFDATRFLYSVQEEFVLSADPVFQAWPYGRPEPRIQLRETGDVYSGRPEFDSWIDGLLNTLNPAYIASGRLGSEGALLWTGNLSGTPTEPLLLGWDGTLPNFSFMDLLPWSLVSPAGSEVVGTSTLGLRRGFGGTEPALVIQDIIHADLHHIVPVSSTAAPLAALGPNLDLVYQQTNAVLRSRLANVEEPYGERTTTVLSTNAGSGLSLATDGTNVAYTVQTSDPLGPVHIQLVTPSGEETLAAWPGFVGAAFQLSGGWVAYTRPGSSGQTQIWTRAPDGTREQRTFFAESSGLESLGPNGVVTFTNRAGRYACFPGNSQAFWVNPGQGRVRWLDNHLYVLLGRSVLEFGLGRLDCVRLAEAGTRLTFSGPNNLTYAIVASSDLHQWTELTRFTSSGGTMSWTNPPSLTPAFYRAVVVPAR